MRFPWPEFRGGSMAIIEHEFDTKEERDAEFDRLKKLGKKPMKGTEVRPVKFKTTFSLRYYPDQSTRK
jgi:hypothetical protein